MICPNCGREIPDGTVCPCTLEAQAWTALSENPALNVIKTVGSSPAFLVMAVFLSVSALLTILSPLGNSSSISSFYQAAYELGWDMDAIASMAEAMRSMTVFGAVVSSIPAILVAVSMWIHYATCRNRLSGNISTAGLTICKVLSYINLVWLCIAAFVVVAALVIVIIAIFAGSMAFPSPSGYRSTYTAEEAQLAVVMVLAVFVLIFGLVLGMGIGYQASIIRTINRTKTVAATGVADDRVSGYFTGMNYLVGASSILSGLFGLFSAPITGAAALFTGVAYILMSVLLNRYRKDMNQVLYPPVQPVMYAPVPGAYQVPVGQQAPVPPQAGQPQAQPPVDNGPHPPVPPEF